MAPRSACCVKPTMSVAYHTTHQVGSCIATVICIIGSATAPAARHLLSFLQPVSTHHSTRYSPAATAALRRWREAFQPFCLAAAPASCLRHRQMPAAAAAASCCCLRCRCCCQRQHLHLCQLAVQGRLLESGHGHCGWPAHNSTAHRSLEALTRRQGGHSTSVVLKCCC
jgi:hypothetical protein